MRRLKDTLGDIPDKKSLNRNILNLSGGENTFFALQLPYIAGTKIIVMDDTSSNLILEKHLSVFGKDAKRILKRKA